MAEESTIDAASILTKVNDYTWDIPMTYKPGMRVPGRIFVSAKLLEGLEHETLDADFQCCNPSGNTEICNGNA